MFLIINDILKILLNYFKIMGFWGFGVFVLQNGLKKYMNFTYNIDVFRCPDEAYIIEYTSGRKVIKILEKKEQNVEGSVETKLWAGSSLKREYELVLGLEFEVFYGFCVFRLNYF